MPIESTEIEISSKNTGAENWKTKNKNKERAEVFRDVIMCHWVNDMSFVVVASR